MEYVRGGLSSGLHLLRGSSGAAAAAAADSEGASAAFPAYETSGTVGSQGEVGTAVTTIVTPPADQGCSTLPLPEIIDSPFFVLEEEPLNDAQDDGLAADIGAQANPATIEAAPTAGALV